MWKRNEYKRLLLIVFMMACFFILMVIAILITKKFYNKSVLTYNSEEDEKVRDRKDEPRFLNGKDDDDFYKDALQDVVIAEQEEIQELVSLSKNDKFATFSKDGKQVLLVTFHHDNQFEQNNLTRNAPYEIWCVTEKELRNWYHNHFDSVWDWETRLKQLFGRPLTDQSDRFTLFYVDVDYVFRPAYNPEVQNSNMKIVLDEKVGDTYKNWFDSQILDSYFYGTALWSRLGYTYDWKPGSGEYGLSEFVVYKDAKIKIVKTYKKEDFIKWMSKK